MVITVKRQANADRAKRERGVGEEPRDDGDVRPGAHGQALIDHPFPGASPPMLSITTRSLSLHPRTPWSPKTAHRDTSTGVRTHCSPGSIAFEALSRGQPWTGRVGARTGPAGPGTVSPQASYWLIPDSAVWDRRAGPSKGCSSQAPRSTVSGWLSQ